jgi:hypothetical protein
MTPMQKCCLVIGFGSVLLFGSTACYPGQAYDVTGIVCTDSTAEESGLRVNEHMFNDEIPLAGAKVRLAFDEKGQRFVPNVEAETDENGYYQLPTKQLSGGREYFLIVEKEGYEPLVFGVTTGLLSHHRHNTAVLKSIK